MWLISWQANGKPINVTVKINVIDATTASTEYNNVTYKDAMMSNFTVVNPFTALNLARAGLAGSTYLTSDPSGMEAMYEAAAANADVVSREAATGETPGSLSVGLRRPRLCESLRLKLLLAVVEELLWRNRCFILQPDPDDQENVD